MNFKEQCQKKTDYIDSVLQKYLPKEENLQKTVIEAMNYSLMAGGKRLRPLFMLETNTLYSGCENEILESFMAAIEMIHTYSLVHDDLPAMDNDAYRRGRKTTHMVYGEAMGILAGDGLLNYAFETAASAFGHTAFPTQVGRALQILAKKAGIYGMIGGQCVDIESEGKKFGQERLDYIYQLKTSALLEASFMIGAVLAGAQEKDIDKMESIARKVGVAFQIQDDILDVISTTEQLGKPIHSDEKNQKITYVTLKGVDKAKEDVAYLSKQALDQLLSIEGDTRFLEQLIQSLINRQK